VYKTSKQEERNQLAVLHKMTSLPRNSQWNNCHSIVKHNRDSRIFGITGAADWLNVNDVIVEGIEPIVRMLKQESQHELLEAATLALANLTNGSQTNIRYDTVHQVIHSPDSMRPEMNS